ncbi:hypothetical protein RF11_12703 [Thelohanellus kitauei]|uniref:Uncharacterized protein n=1 Tax=Thelohanellus kitauei TaxID=669202 RepID=A0A0C2MQV2_THEKT|nr:hypothetical protein RF11_12703 [Thelohanellus kitauei]
MIFNSQDLIQVIQTTTLQINRESCFRWIEKSARLLSMPFRREPFKIIMDKVIVFWNFCMSPDGNLDINCVFRFKSPYRFISCHSSSGLQIAFDLHYHIQFLSIWNRLSKTTIMVTDY